MTTHVNEIALLVHDTATDSTATIDSTTVVNFLVSDRRHVDASMT